MSVSDKANPVLGFFKEKAIKLFGARIISLFKFGSLGDRGDFSLCSDVDVALMLDKLEASDENKINALWDEIKASQLDYADRFSLYWSSYHGEDFNNGKGRFPALDRLDLISHAILITGIDRRAELNIPKHEELVIESAKFILNFMLAGEKAAELTEHPDVIMKKGARYFTKVVLFPVRLIFTLDNVNIIGSNHDAVEYFKLSCHKHLTSEVMELINIAYQLRAAEPASLVTLNNEFVKVGLLSLYEYCIERYSEAILRLGQKELARQLQAAIKK